MAILISFLSLLLFHTIVSRLSYNLSLLSVYEKLKDAKMQRTRNTQEYIKYCMYDNRYNTWRNDFSFKFYLFVKIGISINLQEHQNLTSLKFSRANKLTKRAACTYEGIRSERKKKKEKEGKREKETEGRRFLCESRSGNRINTGSKHFSNFLAVCIFVAVFRAGSNRLQPSV